MKIGIITFHRAENYGAVLQAYALQRYINDNFFHTNAEIIDYRCASIENNYSYRKLIFSGNIIKVIGKIVLKAPRVIRTKRNFKKFVCKYLPLSDKQYDKSSVDLMLNNYDCVISGSDQVFNLEMTEDDTGYYLDSLSSRRCMRISYAASTGTMTEEYLKRKAIQLLKNLDYISFRESSSLEWAKANGINGRVDIDPVLLLDANQWEDILVPINRKPYVLFFGVQDLTKEENTLKFAEDIAKRKNCELLFISIYGNVKKNNITRLRNIRPEEFVSYIKNAECIITDSFHASVFSIIFHKRFFTETNIKNNSRIIDLLTLTGLEKCMLSDGKVINNSENIATDWNVLDDVLIKKREESFHFLQECFTENESGAIDFETEE